MLKKNYSFIKLSTFFTCIKSGTATQHELLGPGEANFGPVSKLGGLLSSFCFGSNQKIF